LENYGKLLTMRKALHPRGDVHRLYLSRKEGGRDMMNVEDTVDLAIINLETYVKDSRESILTGA